MENTKIEVVPEKKLIQKKLVASKKSSIDFIQVKEDSQELLLLDPKE